jgi:acyl transferase domain-containing protein
LELQYCLVVVLHLVYVQVVTSGIICKRELIFMLGVNPCLLRGQNTGVFIGTSRSESERVLNYQKLRDDGLGLTGSARAMFSNRISYWLGTNGKLK